MPFASFRTQYIGTIHETEFLKNWCRSLRCGAFTAKMDHTDILEEFIRQEYSIVKCSSALFPGVVRTQGVIYVDPSVVLELTTCKELAENINKRLVKTRPPRHSSISYHAMCSLAVACYGYGFNEAAVQNVADEDIERVWKLLEVMSVTLSPGYSEMLKSRMSGRTSAGFKASVETGVMLADKKTKFVPFVRKASKLQLSSLPHPSSPYGQATFKEAMFQDLVDHCNSRDDAFATLSNVVDSYLDGSEAGDEPATHGGSQYGHQ